MSKNFRRTAAVLLALIMALALTTVAFAEETPVDTTKLEELLYIADSAEKTNYTSESWQALEAAIEQAKTALNGGDQAAVDAAKKALATALSKVTSMDYTAVENALLDVNRFLDDVEIGTYLKALHDAIQHAESLHGSGDQEGVNRAAEDILQRLEELEKYVNNNQGGGVVWIVLFFVSLAGNLGLAALLFWKHWGNKNHEDNVPLVDYDIDDDIA